MCGSLLSGFWSCFNIISKCSQKPACVSSKTVWSKCPFLQFSVEFEPRSDCGPSMNCTEMAVDMKHTEGVWNTFKLTFCCWQCFCQHILLGWLKASSEVFRFIYKGAKSPCILAGCLVRSWKPAWGAKQERDAPYSQHGFAIDSWSSSASKHYCRRPSHSENTFM